MFRYTRVKNQLPHLTTLPYGFSATPWGREMARYIQGQWAR